MRIPPRPFFVQILAALASGLLPDAAAAQVDDILWSSSFFAENRDSNGRPLDATFSFYLGVFDPPPPGAGEDPWKPTPANTAEWAAHWITADVAPYNRAASNFSGGYQAEPTVEGVDLTGMQGYIWGVNRRFPDGEWILITNTGWTWPAPGTGGLGFPETWTASDGSAIVGQLDQGGVHLRTAPVADAAPPLLKPDLWLQLHFTQDEIDQQQAGVSGWQADPNKNGIPNILEYAFGTHPRRVHSDTQPVHGFLDLAGSTYGRLQATIDPNVEVNLDAEVSPDLVNWSDAILHSQSATGLLFRDTAPLSPAAPFRAMRLKAEFP